MNTPSTFIEQESSVHNNKASRRDVLVYFKQLLLGASALTLCPLSLGADDIKSLTLTRLDIPVSLLLTQVCRLLFPHKSLSDRVYLDVVRDIEVDIIANENTARLIQQLPGLLNKKAGGDWSKASLEQQLNVLSSIQATPLFSYLRNRSIESLYRNPVVWKLIGYQGSSIEYGGYLHRGFDDIDWLDRL